MGQQQPGGLGSLLGMLIPFGLMFVVLYLLIIRPQRQKESERLKMLSNVQKNDNVLTSGGIYGVVMQVKDNEVTIKIDENNNTKIRVAKSAIIGIDRGNATTGENK